MENKVALGVKRLLTFNSLTSSIDKVETEEEKAEREQVRLAQIFAKRARMNRLLEEYEGDAEFSQSRLIDEESISQDLKSIKVGLLFLPSCYRKKYYLCSTCVYCDKTLLISSLFI